MIAVESVTVTAYRSSSRRRKRFTKLAAYRDAAKLAWRQAYPCECEAETGYTCGEHRVPSGEDAINLRATYRRKVVDRLARWLRWRDSRARATVQPFQIGDLVAFVRGRCRGRPSEGTVTEVGRVVETHISPSSTHGSVSVVTAWVTGDGADQRLDGTTRWLVPADWCVRVVMPGGDRPARKRKEQGNGSR